ncbi:hypothetical protein SAMN05518861_14225 [Mesorhizobium sp. YR577]|nr:hypothetical protein SAMN05518861_14225 [Mesorhizobium sp. YR577]
MPAVIGGGQEHARRFQRVAGDDEGLASRLMRAVLVIVPVDGGDAVIGVGVDAIDDGFGQHQRALCLGGLDGVDAIVHSADRTDGLAIVVAAAGRTTVPGPGASSLRDRHRAEAVGIDHLGEALVAIAPRHHVHRIGPAAFGGRLQCGIVRPGDPHGVLGATVIGLQLVIGDGPVETDAVGGAHLQVDRQMPPA